MVQRVMLTQVLHQVQVAHQDLQALLVMLEVVIQVLLQVQVDQVVQQEQMVL
jgi:hypothetical protein